jgi:hypothetical protein
MIMQILMRYDREAKCSEYSWVNDPQCILTSFSINIPFTSWRKEVSRKKSFRNVKANDSSLFDVKWIFYAKEEFPFVLLHDFTIPTTSKASIKKSWMENNWI